VTSFSFRLFVFFFNEKMGALCCVLTAWRRIQKRLDEQQQRGPAEILAGAAAIRVYSSLLD